MSDFNKKPLLIGGVIILVVAVVFIVIFFQNQGAQQSQPPPAQNNSEDSDLMTTDSANFHTDTSDQVKDTIKELSPDLDVAEVATRIAEFSEFGKVVEFVLDAEDRSVDLAQEDMEIRQLMAEAYSDVTVILPTNSAMESLDSETMNTLTTDMIEATEFIKKHIIPGATTLSDAENQTQVVFADGSTRTVQKSQNITSINEIELLESISVSNGTIFPSNTVVE